MNLDEAIKHAEEVANSYKNTIPDCNCALEHRQLAHWLKELKLLRFMVENGLGYEDMIIKPKSFFY